MRARVLALLSLLTLATVAIAACSVVGDGKVDPVNPPFGLADTLLSTTSAAPTTTELITTTSGLDPSTTIVPTEPVRLYYISGGQLVPVSTPLPVGASLPQIVAKLQAGPGPLGDLGTGLRSAVPGPTDADITVADNNTGVALVELPAGFFDNIPVADQRLATAQIVLTLTDSRGIGQVQFNLPVPKPSGALTAAGKPLTRKDYLSLLEGAPTPTSTTTTVRASTTSAGP
jgi:hypothetical protein